jgi:BASS family bile acid:Na+ symporter
LFSVVAATTVFTIMFDLGLAVGPADFGWIRERFPLLLKGLFSVLLAVPAVAWLVAQAFDLPHAAEIGILLMAVSPGAPVALRRSLGAGGHRAYAPVLQVAVAMLAVVSMPLSIAAFNEYYGGQATIDPRVLAKQVFIAQLLPFSLGVALRRLLPAPTQWLEPRLRRIGGVLLVVLLVLALIDIWQVVIGAGLRVMLAIAVVTVMAVAIGHLMGGPDPATRTATAISSAARNPGLALLVATLNSAPAAITATVLAYLVFSALVLVPYVTWRRHVPAASSPRVP